jgi:ATP-binding cassette subfamily B protein
MKQIWIFVRENLHWYIFIGLLLLIVNVAQLVMPIYIGNIIDYISADNLSSITNYHPVWINAIYFTAAAFAIVIFRIIYINIMRRFAIRFEHTKRKQLFQKYLALHDSFFFENEIGDLMARANNDTIAVRRFLVMGLLSMYDIVVLGVGALAIMLTKAPTLTLWIVLPLAILIILSRLVSSHMHRLYKQIQETFADITTSVRETLVGMNVIRTFCRETFYMNKFIDICSSYLRINLNLGRLMGLFNPAIAMVISITILLITIIGGYQVMNGIITLGTLVEFTQYIQLLAWPMMAVGFVVNMYQRASISMDRIQEILTTPSADAEQRIVLKPHLEMKVISVKNLSFAYPQQNRESAIQNLSLDLHKGENIGITGPTGSGKTTILSLLLRIWDPPENTIFIDDIDVTHIHIDTLRKQFAYVPQVSFLFSNTVWENLRFGKPDAQKEEIMEAARIARVLEDVEKLDHGFDTIIGERGVTLSGGQKQRLALARALVTQRPFLILDDSLSAVDPETEEIIIQNLKEHLRKSEQTCIIVSHRITTLYWLDKIAVIEKGKITESNSPNALIESQKGYFYRLYHYQYLEGLEGLKNGI